MEPQNQLTDTQRQQLLLCLTTEHSALQSARSNTVSEANGRVGLFLGVVSSSLIALGFVGQGSIAGDAFLVFAVIILPLLLFLGYVTFRRVLESSIEDLFYARGINRIRHFYVELAPQMQDYFIQSTHDDAAGVFTNMGIQASRWQLLLTSAGMVSVINGVTAGALAVLIAARILALPAWVGIGSGVAVFLVAVSAQYRYQSAVHRRSWESIKPLFPSEPVRTTPPR